VARPSPHDRQKTEIPALLDRHNSKLRRRDPILKGYRSASLKRAPWMIAKSRITQRCRSPVQSGHPSCRSRRPAPGHCRSANDGGPRPGNSAPLLQELAHQCPRSLRFPARSANRHVGGVCCASAPSSATRPGFFFMGSSFDWGNEFAQSTAVDFTCLECAAQPSASDEKRPPARRLVQWGHRPAGEALSPL
jgi:hypothetical protein